MEIPKGMPDRSSREIKPIPNVLVIANKPNVLKKGVKTVIPGFFVRSKEEAAVVQALQELRIMFEYEQWRIIVQYGSEEDIHSTKRFLVPDFYLSGYDIFLEHFGMYRKELDYYEETQRKVQLYKDSNLKYIFTLTEDVKNGVSNLKELIKKRIKAVLENSEK